MLYRGRRLPGSKRANPFKIGPQMSREESIDRYRTRLLASPDLLAALPELRGKVLACWCKEPDRAVACHGDVLAELADVDVGQADG